MVYCFQRLKNFHRVDELLFYKFPCLLSLNKSHKADRIVCFGKSHFPASQNQFPNIRSVDLTQALNYFGKQIKRQTIKVESLFSKLII